MGLLDWIAGFWGDRTTVKLNDSSFYELAADYYFKKLAVDTSINLIANTLASCEFQTFEKGKELRGENYYLLNVSPNQNQNASEFFQSLVNHLFKENEALVIMQNDHLYIADDFVIETKALYENKYKNVKVNDFVFDKTFFESEVLHFKLNDSNIKKIIDELNSSYGKLITSAMSIYKRSNAKRVVLKGNFLRPQTDAEQALINEMFDSQFKAWFEADKAGAVFQLQEGYSLEDLSGAGKSGTAPTNSRDVRSLADDIFDFVAMGFQIPRGLLKGDLADVEKQVDSYLMFRINPLAELIADEFNRKMYSKEEFLRRTYTKINTSMIKILDIVNLATAADKFFAIGVNTINDNLRMLGREPINEDWANQRFVTKNYQTIENVNASEGGEGR
ncbi:phage portal protein [Neobacillus niacini]|uniref:phage portal protein n=1 Tax=Neobacillus niacini TaxID=86668 RepID=UPI002FFE8E34